MTRFHDGLGRVYISSTSFRNRSLAHVLAGAHEVGAGAVELSALDDWDPGAVLRSPHRFLLHNYCPPPSAPFVLNVASSDPETLDRSLAHCRAAIDLSAVLGAPVYAAHAGYATGLAPELLGNPRAQAGLPVDAMDSYEDTYARLVASARTLTTYARSRGIRFLIENHCLSAMSGPPGRRLLPMVTSQELRRLVADVGDESFGVLADVGHLNVSAQALGFDRVAFLDDLGPCIGGFHLSDNDGVVDEHRGFGRDAWFMPIVREYRCLPITIELNRAATDEIRRTLDVVASLL
ncbi:MAG: sugar phosphate isomerase/epimerase family protein [Acidobacteriota bacterium]